MSCKLDLFDKKINITFAFERMNKKSDTINLSSTFSDAQNGKGTGSKLLVLLQFLLEEFELHNLPLRSLESSTVAVIT